MTNWLDHKKDAEDAWKNEDYGEAVRHWVSAIKIAENYGKEDGRFVTCLDGLGKAHYLKGDYPRAEKLYRQALTVRDRNLPSGHKDIATSAVNLAASLFYLKKYEESEKLFRKALTIRKQSCGEKSNEVAWVLYQLGILNHAQKRYPQADEYYKQAMELKNKLLGHDHIEMIALLRNYADVLKKVNREEISERMEKYAKEIEEKHSN